MDTSAVILAIASPPGRSPRGIVRISGDATFNLLRPHLSDDVSNHRGMHTSRLRLRAFNLPAIILSFPAPHSYTGEDSVELQLPGNPLLLQRVIDALIDSGTARDIVARRAEGGEFTARAFFNAKLSLTQAEGVAAIIAARSDAQLRAAHVLCSGDLGSFVHELADDLATALALVEAGIDFTDSEDVIPITPADLHARLRDLCDRIDAHLSRSVGAEQLQAIPWVVITGPPNAGKSTLFNTLLDRPRAVVSPLPGTTRDVLAEPLSIDTPHGPAEVMLVDLAGADAGDSPLNRQMQSAASQAIGRAELILHCIPVDQPPPQPLAASRSSSSSPPPSDPSLELLVRTKSDLPHHPPHCGFAVSATTGHGLDTLRAMIAERLADRAVSLAADALALQPRHESALRSTHRHLAEAAALVAAARDRRALPQPELLAAAMRLALDSLAELAGDITPDDVLGRIFSTFCIGK